MSQKSLLDDSEKPTAPEQTGGATSEPDGISDNAEKKAMEPAASKSPVDVNVAPLSSPPQTSEQQTKGQPSTAAPRNESHNLVTRFVHEQLYHVSKLSDKQVLEECLKAGITGTIGILVHGKSDDIEQSKMRDQLVDFKAFTQFINGVDRKPLALADGLVNSKPAQLWIREDKVLKKKGLSGLVGSDGGLYKWVHWRDGAGIVRSRVPREGTALVKTVRTMRWPGRLERWKAFSFQGRDAHSPFERHCYTNQAEPVPVETSTESLEKQTTPSDPAPHVTKAGRTKIFFGAQENRNCTLLRLETIDALKLYSQRDFSGFMDFIHKHKSIITKDILNNLNRGPIFSAAMVGYALEHLVKASLTEYIPHETFQYVRDIMYHYLANRNLHHTIGGKWQATAFDTTDFNAMNYMSNDFCDGFFAECQDVIRVGYGNTVEQRCRSGAVVMALLYSASIAAMDVADKDNALYAQNLCRSVGVIFNVAESLVLASPIPQASAINKTLLEPFAGQIRKKIHDRYVDGALRKCVVDVFRDMYIVGALRGERISGMRRRHERDLHGLLGDEKIKFQQLMKKRRELGRKFVDMAQMYVTSIGEEWPVVAAIDEDIFESLV